MIKAEGISKKFGSIIAVNNVNLQVKEGEIFGLVGPDGAGKTTLMRIICDLILSDKGVVRVNGQTARERKKAKQENMDLGYMPQRFSLYGDLTVMENLIFFGSMYKLDKKVIKERSDKILGLTNLIQYKNRFGDNLSGGMKQKLALTCALIIRPKLLILDEPTYGVDPESRKEFWKILYSLNKEGITILVSTPYMDEAELCWRVAFMNEGKFVSVDTPVNLKKKFPYRVLELSANTKDPELFSDIEEVKDASLYGDKFRLIVSDSDIGMKKVLERLTKISAESSYINQVSPSMEDVFIMLAGSEV